jgi:hypothetical protein
VEGRRAGGARGGVRRTLLLLTLAFAACEKAFPVDGRDAAGSGGAVDVGRVVDVDAARGDGEAEKDEASTGDAGRDDAKASEANARYADRAFGASTFTVEFVASAGVVVPYGLALDAAGVPVVAYTVGNTLHVARRTAPGVWTTTHSAPLGNPLRAAFLTLGPSDEPYVAVSTMTVMGTTARLDVAQAGLPTASSWTFEPLVAQEVTGVVRRATGALDVSVVSNTRDLRVHTRAPQGGWSVETVQFDVIANVLRANRQGDVRSVYSFNRTGFVDRGLVVSSPDPVNGWMREHEVRQSLGVGRQSLDGAVGSSGAWSLVGDVSPGGELYVFER